MQFGSAAEIKRLIPYQYGWTAHTLYALTFDCSVIIVLLGRTSMELPHPTLRHYRLKTKASNN